MCIYINLRQDNQTMKTNSIVGIDTVDWSIHGERNDFNLPASNRVNLISPEGEVLHSYQNRKCFPGRYNVHNLQVRTLHSGAELLVQGSPYAYLFGQNLYTSNDLCSALHQILPKILQQCAVKQNKVDVRRWMVKNIDLKRVDLYANFWCPVGVTPLGFIRQIARLVAELGFSTYRFRTSFYWAPDKGRDYQIGFYAKGPQMRQKSSLKDFPAYKSLLSEADNVVRVELRLKAAELRRLGLNKASNWTVDTPRKVFGMFMKKLNILNVTSGKVTSDELDKLPNAR